MTSYIGALCGNVTITILFHKAPITLIVDIGSLKSVSFSVFLDGSTISAAILKLAFKLRTVGKAHNALTVRLTSLEQSFDHVATLLGELSTTVLLVSLPLAHISITVLPDKGTLSMLVAVLELSGVLIAICILKDTGSIQWRWLQRAWSSSVVTSSWR